MEFYLQIIKDFFFAFFVAYGFAYLFNTPKKVLIVAGLLGSVGHALRFILNHGFDLGLIMSTLCGAVLIGLLGIVIAHRVHTPPFIFTMPACITMIPGVYAYKTMLGFIKLTDKNQIIDAPNLLHETMHNFVYTASLLFTLAIGISIGVLLFRQDSAKMIRFLNRKKTNQEV